MLPGEERRLCISGSLEDVRNLAEFTRNACEALLPETDSCAVELALVEAATNIVEHALTDSRGNLVELCIKHIGSTLEFRLIHQGEIYRPPNYDSPDGDDVGLLDVAESGRGFFLMQSLMDDIRIESKGELSTFTMYKNLGDSAVYSKSPVPLLSQKAEYSKLVHEEMEIAAELHRKLVPHNLPKVDGLEIFARTEAARLVGGDYITFHKASDDVLYFMICDAMGKGMSAAFFSVIAHVTFRGILQMSPDISPGAMLSRANNIMADDFDMFEMFMTALVGKIDTSDDSLAYASAGHCQPIFYSGGDLFLLEDGDFMFGVDSEYEYKTYHITFEKGDRLVAYTDGITDITDNSGNLIGVEPLLYACLTEFRLRNTKDSLNKIFDEVKSFSGKTLQDDISLIGLERV